MSTTRLYYDDSYLIDFAARIVARDGMRVALDRSAFYPEGGGQPADHGFISGVPVVDVQVDDDGLVWHTVDGALPAGTVEGVIDWPRRLDHIQQHHGQHLLSAAFEELHGFRTVSFHLGPQSSTIDLATANVTAEQAAAAEALTNQVIWEDRPVEARFVTAEELATIPLRKPPAVSGAIRVVSVPGFDHSACGGTHPRATGGVGLLHLRRLERRGGETRVEFVCGGRALRDLRHKDGIVSRLASAASVGLDELEDAIGRLREEHAVVRKRLAEASAQLIGAEAEALCTVASGQVMVRVFDGRDVAEVIALAREIARRNGSALFGARSGGRATLIFVTAAAGGPFDAGALLRETLARFGGKGGGQKGMAQGNLEQPDRAEEVLDWAITRLSGPA